MERIYLGCA